MPGARNMARDEAEARCAGPGIPVATLRLYGFEPPAVTLGRFQDLEGTVDPVLCAREGIDVVRRATGGLAILHLEDFTYSVVMRSSGGKVPGRRECFDDVARGIVAALGTLGVEAAQVEHGRRDEEGGPWCVEGITGVDIEWNGKKICGSAQRVFAGGVLQHGSLFLRDTADVMARIGAGGRSGSTGGARFAALDEAVGRAVSREEMSVAFREGFESEMRVSLETGSLTDAELELAEELERTKYAGKGWTTGRWPEGAVGGL